MTLAVVLPLAAVLGYYLATPDTFASIGVFGLVVAALLAPVFLRWHHPMLVFFWNSAVTAFFLPGQIGLWMPLAVGSAFITIVAHPLNRAYEFPSVPRLTWVLIVFGAVVAVTAQLTGGIGIRATGGGSYGGKRYGLIFFAICGYFALSWHRIAIAKVNTYIAAYFLSGLSAMVSNLVYLAGPAFYFLYYFFPVDMAEQQIIADLRADPNQQMLRLGGVGFGCLAGLFYILARYGAAGILNLQHPMRLVTWTCLLLASLVGGFRSIPAIGGLTFLVQFYLEGLHRTRWTLVFLLVSVLGFSALIPTAHRLPFSIQRSLSFLPLDIDPMARLDAKSSIEWRLEMWQIVSRDIPKYFLLGKGYSLNPTDLYLVEQSRVRGMVKGFETSIIAGDYHNGPLSLLIPFGIFGAVAFVVFIWLAIGFLVRAHRYGDPKLRNINVSFLAIFLVRTFWFFVCFGSVSTDLFLFTGILGMSVALNGPQVSQKTAMARAAAAIPPQSPAAR